MTTIPKKVEMNAITSYFLRTSNRFRTFVANFSTDQFGIKLPLPISAEEYKERRRKFTERIMTSIGHKSADSQRTRHSFIAVFFAARRTFGAPDIPHIYRQCSNFRYLCGISQPDCRLVIDGINTVLFIAEESEHKTLWEGPSTSQEEIQRISGVDMVLGYDEFDTYLATVIRSNTLLAVDMERAREENFFNSEFKKTMMVFQTLPKFRDLRNAVEQVRWIKSPAEQEIMKTTCRIGSEALNSVIIQSKEYSNESHLVALLDLEARRRGAIGLAYPPVVAAGQNANTLHYIKCDKTIFSSDSLLIDAGCEFDGYCSDITRCFPHSGRFSSAQRTLYDVLDSIQGELLHYVKNHRPLRLNELYRFMMEKMCDALRSIVFFKGDHWTNDELLEECDRFCPHHVSHYLGLDVHDTGSISRAIDLRPGVVITVEPGIYVRHENAAVRDEFRGIGMRIEDDVLITETGAEVLTESCIRKSDEIEFIMSQ